MKHIHIVGTGPRTGTTLLAEALKFCCEIDFASDHEDRLFARPNKPVNTFLTKHPADLFAITPSLQIDPNLHIICLMRDPRDAVSSKHGKNKSQYWGTLRYWQTFIPMLEELLSHPRFTLIRYEEFVSSPDDTQRQLIEAIPCLHVLHPFSEYHNVATPSEESKKALKSLRPIGPQGIGSWKNNLPRIKQQLNLHGDISDSLIQYGYEESADWVKHLDNIAPYEGDSHLPEYFSSSDIKARKRKRKIEAGRRWLANKGVLSHIWPKSTQITN